MFQALRRHVNPTTFIALLALVFALTGGAFAATSASSGSGGAGSSQGLLATASKAKAKAKAGPRGPAGPRGATGAAGAIGAVGAIGPAGATGAAGPAGPVGAGIPGSDGKEGPQGKEGKEGPQGPKGTSGFTDTLPSGKTETGTWSTVIGPVVSGINAGIGFRQVSFAIPLLTPIAEANVKVKLEGYDGTDQTGVEHEECPGSAEDAKAAAGKLCVYTSSDNGIEPTELVRSTTPDGVIIQVLSVNAGQYAYGTWAVTAE
jgi:hypothetical protein